MEFREIRQLSRLEGTNRNPDSTEDGKFLKWNNSTGYAEFSQIGDGGDSDINTTYFTTFVNNLVDSGGNDYLSSITRINDTGRFTLLSGSYLDLELGSLAWEDEVEATLTLPGDTQVLLDVSDEIGGSTNFIYDYTLDRLKLKAPIMFDTDEGTYKEGLQYLGVYSWSVGNGLVSTATGSYNFTGGYLAGASLGSTSANNLIMGPWAGQSAATTLSNSIFLGAYAGRYETADDKFFLDNQDYSDTATAQDSSFMYAELGTERRLYVRDRLSVEKEGKFGYSELADAAGEYGMYQMSATTGGEPQWHDGSVWQTFANSTNTYLSSVGYADGDLTFTLSDTTEVGPIDISGVNVTSFATSPSSPATGQTTVSNYGYLQLSNSAFTNNEGFTYAADLIWNSSLSELQVPGALKITSKTAYTAENGVINYNGSHFYGRVSDSWIQLDNNTTTGEANALDFQGTIADDGDITLTKDGLLLPIKGLKPASTESRIAITDNASDLDLDFSLDLTPAISFISTTSTPTSGPVYALKEISNVTSTAPTWSYKPFICTDSSLTFTESNDEIIVSATGTGNPNIYTINDSVDTGATMVDLATSGSTDFYIKTLEGVDGTHITASNDSGGLKVNLEVDDITWTDTTTTGTDVFLIDQDASDSFVFTQRSIQGSNGITINDDESVDISLDKEVPKFSFITTPSYSGSILSFTTSYDDDIRNTESLATTTMFELLIGDGLTYTSSTNTLSANISGTSGTAGDSSDYRLISVVENNTTENYVRELTVGNGLGTNENVFSLSIPINSLSTATYSDNTTPLIGGIMIDESIKTWTLGDTQQLTLDEATGTLSIDPSIITYEAQNELYDAGNTTVINDSRDLARANIGAAYINGSSTEEFNGADIIAEDKFYCDHLTSSVGDAEFGTECSQIEAVIFRGPHITTTSVNDALYLIKRPSSSDYASRVGVKNGSILMSVNEDQGDGTYTFYKSDNSGNLTKLMKLDSDGNLYISGNIYADGGIEGFNTDSW